MAKFCTKCGKPLKDGKPCDCEKEQTDNLETNENTILNDLITLIKNMFKKPSSTLAKEANEHNFNLSLITIGVNAIMFGLVIHFLLTNIFAKVGIDLSVLTSSLNSLKSQLSSLGVAISFDTNFGLKAGIGMLIMSGVITGLLYVMHKIVFKKNIDYKEIISIVGLSELVFTIGLVVTFIISFISPLLALIILLLSSLMFCVHIHQGMIELGKINKDQTTYTVAVSLIIPVVLFLSIFISMAAIEVIFLIQGTYSSSSLFLSFINI